MFQIFNFGIKPKVTILLPTWFKIIFVHSVYSFDHPVWRTRMGFSNEETLGGLFLSRAGSILGWGSGWKTTAFVWNHKYFILTKIREDPSCGSKEKAEHCPWCVQLGADLEGGGGVQDPPPWHFEICTRGKKTLLDFRHYQGVFLYLYFRFTRRTLNS